eukprot:TRINITY_DN153_c0_g1_i1.p1 TRINITY_DN153_c0_g1~~TRINITY_DN153_c0_g1_i1.p1  ORF type:complete len:110 (+),score=48.32 TRINITY_DN153_c0_g1_i1:76-405(+)
MFRRALVSASASFKSTPTTLFATKRTFATGTFLDKELVTGRVLNVVKNFQKVDPAQSLLATATSQTIGLDSLDTVEVVMAFEDEFALEIPDAEAEKNPRRSAMPSATFP